MLLIGSYRLLQIISQKSNINFRLMQLQQKLMDLQSYASSIADGTVSLNDLMNAPASMFSRMSVFMMYSHQAAMTGAQQNYQPMVAMAQSQGVFANMPPQQQQQMSQMIFKNLYDQQREKFNKVEQSVLNQEEKKIQQQVAQLQTQLQMLDAEQKTTQEQVDKDAKDSAPKYA